jgi:hypothetical protein
MSKRDSAEAALDELCALADARYYAWHARAVQPEREALFAALQKQKVSSGRELKALRIAQEQLVRAARKRISIYRSVAREHDCREMLSDASLDAFWTHIMRSVAMTLSSLRSSTRRAASAMGVPHSSLLHDRRYDQSKAQILTIANIALAPLRAEGPEKGSDSSAPNAVKKERGRPQLIPDERKIAAAALKAAGGTNRQAAALLYSAKYPTDQQTKNVPAILKHHLKKSGTPDSSINSGRTAPKT